MSAEHDDLYYWTVEFPGLAEPEARCIAEWANGAITDTNATAVDPRHWLTWRLDRGDVVAVVHAIRLATPHLKAPHAEVAGALLGEMETWLRGARG